MVTPANAYQVVVEYMTPLTKDRYHNMQQDLERLLESPSAQVAAAHARSTDELTVSSTDANVPMSLGRPAVTVGGVAG